MSGYDPMEELGKELDSLERSPRRKISVAPPPTDDFTAEVERPVQDQSAEPPNSSDPGSPESAGSPVASDHDVAVVALPTKRRRNGLATRSPNGPMKAVSVSLPAHIVERLTALRLDAEVAGHPLKLTEMVSTALLDLPLKPSAVAALVDRYSGSFNYDRSPRDVDFIEESRLSTQITPDAAQRVATIVRAVYQEYGSKLSNKDLYAVALLSFMAERT